MKGVIIIMNLSLILACSNKTQSDISFTDIDKSIVSLGFSKKDESTKKEDFGNLYIFENIQKAKGGFYPNEKEIKAILQGKNLTKILKNCTYHTSARYQNENTLCYLTLELFSFQSKTSSAFDLFGIFKRYACNERLTDNFPNQQLILFYDKDTFLLLRNYCNVFLIESSLYPKLFGTDNLNDQIFMLNNFNH